MPPLKHDRVWANAKWIGKQLENNQTNIKRTEYMINNPKHCDGTATSTLRPPPLAKENSILAGRQYIAYRVYTTAEYIALYLP
jgi:hypothetical protein